MDQKQVGKKPNEHQISGAIGGDRDICIWAVSGLIAAYAVDRPLHCSVLLDGCLRRTVKEATDSVTSVGFLPARRTRASQEFEWPGPDEWLLVELFDTVFIGSRHGIAEIARERCRGYFEIQVRLQEALRCESLPFPRTLRVLTEFDVESNWPRPLLEAICELPMNWKLVFSVRHHAVPLLLSTVLPVDFFGLPEGDWRVRMLRQMQLWLKAKGWEFYFPVELCRGSK